VLQRLEAADGLAELHARAQIFERHGQHAAHQGQQFGAREHQGFVVAARQCRHRGRAFGKQVLRGHTHVGEFDFGGLAAVRQGSAVQAEPRGIGGHPDQRQALRTVGTDDEAVGTRAGTHMALAALQLQAIRRALEPRARVLGLVFGAGEVFLPGHGGQQRAGGHVGQQLVCERALGHMREHAAGKHQHGHHGLGRHLRCERAGHFGHLGQALRVASLRLGHQQARPALFGERRPEAAVEAGQLLAQCACAGKRGLLACETERAFAQKGKLFSAFAVG